MVEQVNGTVAFNCLYKTLLNFIYMRESRGRGGVERTEAPIPWPSSPLAPEGLGVGSLDPTKESILTGDLVPEWSHLPPGVCVGRKLESEAQAGWDVGSWCLHHEMSTCSQV